MSTSVYVRRRTAALMFFLCFAFGGDLLRAQARWQPLVPAMRNDVSVLLSQPAQARTGTSAFLVEAAGAAAGSALGFGILYLTASECDGEDLACTLEKVFIGIALGTAGAAAGAVIAGRSADTEPSTIGAVLGAVAGAAGGIGLWRLFTEKLDVGNHTAGAAITYIGTQAIVTALGSRIFRALK
jgi:hypothetical protein